jgi:hypothetical protein
MGGSVTVDPAVLKQAAEGIDATIGELSKLGIAETGASGRGFSLVALSPLQAGKAIVQSGFQSFADRWSWGIRQLVQAGNSLSVALGLAAGRYYAMDQEASNALKVVVTDLMGNPHLSTAQIEKLSWGQVFADNPVNDILHPDYSPASFEQAFHEVVQDGKTSWAAAPQALANVTGFDAPAVVNAVRPGTVPSPRG